MSKEADVLIELADIAACLGGDFHTMHLNVCGVDFDTMHKKTLKKYYEEADNDYDTFAEMARRKPWAAEAPTKNDSAKRIEWKSYEGICNREQAVKQVAERLEFYLDQMNKVFGFFEKNKKCPVSQGIASWIQDRMNYWGSEWGFFNASREEKHANSKISQFTEPDVQSTDSKREDSDVSDSEKDNE